MVSFPVQAGICAALSSVAGLALRMGYTPCAVPINGPKFRIDLPHVAGGVCEQRILALQNYIYVRIQVRVGRMCGFQECDQIATPLAGFSCAACVTSTSAAVTSELLPYLLYSVGMHA